MLPDVFEFIKDYVVPIISPEDSKQTLSFQIIDYPTFSAGVREIRTGGINIYISNGAAQRVYDYCNEHTALINASTRLADDRADGLALTGLTYASAFVFLLLHEYGHGAGGHLAFMRENYPEHFQSELGFSEIHKPLPLSSEYSRFRRMSELEADGFAFAITLEFSDDICTSIGLEYDKDQDSDDIQKAVLLGSFLSVCLLDGIFEEKEEGEYPFVASRIINLFSSYLRLVEPNTVRWSDDNHRFVVPDKEKAREITQVYEKTISPMLIVLHTTLKSMGLESRFFDDNYGEDSSSSIEFMQDIEKVLGGSTPVASAYGRALAALTPHRVEFMRGLEKYRQLDLWPMEAAEDNLPGQIQ